MSLPPPQAVAAGALLLVGVLLYRQRKRRRERWDSVLDGILPAIVVIKVNFVKPFDGDQAGSSHATGFVVDAARGIILTNRHVIGTGPVRAEATFSNKEELPLTPLYRDPVHDFGFFHFDASQLKYANILPEIKLAPHAAKGASSSSSSPSSSFLARELIAVLDDDDAVTFGDVGASKKVGLDIRVVGNDAGEKVSILSGTLARLDRNAPHYQSDGYNDFNTFYYCAASNTSGGSSGSPVLDRRGRAVALNAGGSNNSSASYYLPLHGVVRALDALRTRSPHRDGGHIKDRGTLRIVWRHQTCDEMRRLALRPETEAALRANCLRTTGSDSSAGLLVCDQVIRGGTGEAAGLEVGDILVAMDSPATGRQSFPDFELLEVALDSAVGSSLSLVVERGGAVVEFGPMAVENLHALNPRDFVEFGGGVFHTLSYGALRNGNLRLEAGVYVAFTGFVLDAASVPAHSVVTAVGDRLTPDLDAFEAVAWGLRDGDRVTMRFFAIGDQYNEQVALLRVNRRWFDVRRWHRVDLNLAEVLRRCAAGTCDPEFSASWVTTALTTTDDDDDDDDDDEEPREKEEGGGKEAATPAVLATFQRLGQSALADAAVSCLCKVSFDVLHAIDGVHDWHFAGAGIVVDAEHGLVAVDRNTVVTSLGECSVTFAACVELRAKLVFVHPSHNFALIRYDSAVFDGAPPDRRPTSARLPASDNGQHHHHHHQQLAVGEELTFVGLCRANPDQSLSQKVVVTEISCVNIAQAHVPRFRALNEDIAKFDQVINKSLGGLFVDGAGQVVATWSCYSFYSWNDEKNYEAFHAVDVGVMVGVCRKVLATPAREPVTNSIGLGLKRLPLSTAITSMKLDATWVTKLQNTHPDRSQVLFVSQRAHAQLDEAEAAAATADAAAASAASSKKKTKKKNGQTKSNADAPPPPSVLEGDLVLAVDGATTTTFRDVEDATKDRASVELTMWRDGRARQVRFATEPIYGGAGTERVLVWCGLLLQVPHRAAREMGVPKSEVYCSYYLYGSPAHFYSIKACRFIVEVNGAAVRTLDDFVRATRAIPNGTAVRIKTSDLQGQLDAKTLKTDYTFWPSHQFLFQQGDWVMQEWLSEEKIIAPAASSAPQRTTR